MVSNRRYYRTVLVVMVITFSVWSPLRASEEEVTDVREVCEHLQIEYFSAKLRAKAMRTRETASDRYMAEEKLEHLKEQYDNLNCIEIIRDYIGMDCFMLEVRHNAVKSREGDVDPIVEEYRRLECDRVRGVNLDGKSTTLKVPEDFYEKGPKKNRHPSPIPGQMGGERDRPKVKY